MATDRVCVVAEVYARANRLLRGRPDLASDCLGLHRVHYLYYIYIYILTNIYNSNYTNLHLCLLLYMLQSLCETNILIVVCLDICSALVEDVE